MFVINPNTYKLMDYTYGQKAEMSPKQVKIMEGKAKNLKEVFLRSKLRKFQKARNANKKNSSVNISEIIQTRAKNSRS